MDKDVPYTWCVWSEGLVGRFKLFTTPVGENYLTWISGSTMSFAEVSKSKDRLVPMTDYPSKMHEGVTYVPVGEIIDRRELVDRETTAHFYSIHVVSLEKSETGIFRIKLYGKDPNKIYTVVSDSKEKLSWRLE